jgi:hypothetical protein
MRQEDSHREARKRARLGGTPWAEQNSTTNWVGGARAPEMERAVVDSR